MRKILLAVCVALSLTGYSKETVTNVVNITNLPKAERAKLREIFKRYEGGRMAKPGSCKGVIACVNAQCQAKAEWIHEALTNVNEKLHYNIRFESGKFELPMPKVVGDATLYVIDDPAMPTILSAPENRWVMVNVSRLASGDGGKTHFFEARVKKEIVRGFALLAGSQDSGYPRSLLRCMTRPEDLDEHIDARLPVDIVKRFGPYLAGYGVKPEMLVTYRKACEEGWAPRPTNDVQRAVWDEVHAVPEKPIRIKYDPKRDAAK